MLTKERELYGLAKEKLDKAFEQITSLVEEADDLEAKLAIAMEAMKQSVARSDDYGDSWCSKPIREALAKIRGGYGSKTNIQSRESYRVEL